MVLAATLFVIPVGISGTAIASTSSTESSFSVYLTCSSILFAEPSASGTCGSGAYSAAYTGISQTLGSTQNSVVYMASATGGVKVNYTLFDVTSGKLLIKWLGYGAVGGGSCATPTAIYPATPQSGSTAYLINSGQVLASGDVVRLYLNSTFTPDPGTSGSPVFCAGGAAATLVSLGTTVVTGTAQANLTTELTAGTPSQTTLSGVPGVAETYTYAGSTALSVLVLGVVKNSAGSTIDVITSSFSATAGQTVTAFLPLGQYPSGRDSVTEIAFPTSNVAISTPAVAAVTV